MEDRKFDRRCDTGTAFPLRTTTNQPSTRSMGVAAVPVLMKSSSTKSALEEVSERRRRECMSQQLRGPSLPSKSLFMGALGGAKAATASDLPTITGKKPLPRALLPKEARKTSYQAVISGPFAFSSSGLGAMTAGPASVMQRRSSISSCYPLRPSAVRHERVITNGTVTDNRSTTEKKPQAANDDDSLWRLSLDRARRNSVNTLSPPPTDVPSQISLSRGRSSAGGGVVGMAVEKQNIDTESIYPMLRMAFGKDEKDDDDSSLIRRTPGRQGAGKRERPISYADPNSFRKMQEDMQTPNYMEYPLYSPSYDPTPEPTETSFDTNHASVRSESSYISNKTPGLTKYDFEKDNDSNPIQLSTTTIKPNNGISEDQIHRVPSLYEDVKPEPRNSLTMKLNDLTPGIAGLKPQSPITTKVVEISPNAKKTETKSPVPFQSETVSPGTTEPKIQSPSTKKPEALSADTTGFNREDWYSPIPASPRRVIRSPRLSSSASPAEIYSPLYRSPSTIESVRKPRPAFVFDVEDSMKNKETESYTKSSDADQSVDAEENNNNTPPELPSSAPPPLPLSSLPSDAPALPPSALRHSDIEYSSTIIENSSSKPARDETVVETVPPTLPASAPPPLPGTPPPISASNIFPSGLCHPDVENGSSLRQTPDSSSSNEPINDDTATAETGVSALSYSSSPSLTVTSHPTDDPIIVPSFGIQLRDVESSSSSTSPDASPEIRSSEPTNDHSTTTETVPPALPSSIPPPLPMTSPPMNAPIVSPVGVHHEDLEHISSSETDSYFNESVAGNEGLHGATAEKNNEELEQTASVGRQQRQSLSSEESLIEGQETKSCSAPNRETLSPTLSDADSGIDCVKLEQKRNYESSITTEEYQAALWDEPSETNTGRQERAVSPVSNDRSTIDDTSPDATLSNVTPATVEPQESIRIASDCVVMTSPDVLLTPIEMGSERNEESVSNKTTTTGEESDAFKHCSENGEDINAFPEDAKKSSSDDLPLAPVTPLPSEEDRRVIVLSEVSEKSDVTSVGQRKLTTTVQFQKGIMGLGFSVQGGKGSAYGDMPLTVKKIFKAGDASVREVLTVGDELFSANGKDLTNCSLHEAWNYLKTLPDGTIDLVIGKASDL